MTKPATLLTGDARRVGFLVSDANAPFHHRGLGDVTPAGGDDHTAHTAVATHLAGGRANVTDPLVLTGGVLTLADTLAAGIDDEVTALTVHLATSSPASEFVARIGTEDILVTAGFGTTAWTIERAHNGTTAAAHLEDAAVGVVVAVPLIVNAAGALAVADAVRVNTALTILASGARTTTQTQADQTNLIHHGIRVVLDVTVNGAGGSITLEIDAKDLASGKYVAMLTGSAVTDVRTVTYLVYPSATAAANAVAADHLPLTWRVLVTANNANAVTYSVGAVLLV